MWCHAERNTKDKDDSIGQEKGTFLSEFKVATDPYFLTNSLPARVNYWSPRICYMFFANSLVNSINLYLKYCSYLKCMYGQC